MALNICDKIANQAVELAETKQMYVDQGWEATLKAYPAYEADVPEELWGHHPVRRTRGACGADVCLPKDLTLKANSGYVRVDTGLLVTVLGKLSARWRPYIQIKNRSSNMKKGIRVWEGVVDCDYGQKIKLFIKNKNPFPVRITTRYGVCQFLTMKTNIGGSAWMDEDRIGGEGSTDNQGVCLGEAVVPEFPV